MVKFINHIIWRYIKYNPNQYKLLDVRHNIMKNLILGDCNHLIKFILFGNEENEEEYKNKEEEKEKEKEKFKIKHIPKSILWKDNEFVNDDDLDKKNESKDIGKIIPENDMELAIYHCKGKFQSLKSYVILFTKWNFYLFIY